MTTIRDFTITRFSFRRDRIIGDSQVRADSCYAAALELHTDDGRTGLASCCICSIRCRTAANWSAPSARKRSQACAASCRWG